MALESILNRTYTHQSDVWSYGMYWAQCITIFVSLPKLYQTSPCDQNASLSLDLYITSDTARIWAPAS